MCAGRRARAGQLAGNNSLFSSFNRYLWSDDIQSMQRRSLSARLVPLSSLKVAGRNTTLGSSSSLSSTKYCHLSAACSLSAVHLTFSPTKRLAWERVERPPPPRSIVLFLVMLWSPHVRRPSFEIGTASAAEGQMQTRQNTPAPFQLPVSCQQQLVRRSHPALRAHLV